MKTEFLFFFKFRLILLDRITYVQYHNFPRHKHDTMRSLHAGNETSPMLYTGDPLLFDPKTGWEVWECVHGDWRLCFPILQDHTTWMHGDLVFRYCNIIQLVSCRRARLYFIWNVSSKAISMLHFLKYKIIQHECIATLFSVNAISLYNLCCARLCFIWNVSSTHFSVTPFQSFTSRNTVQNFLQLKETFFLLHYIISAFLSSKWPEMTCKTPCFNVFST